MGKFMIDKVKIELPGYEIVPVTKENFEQAFEAYDTNQDFFMLVNGKEATIKSSIGDINALPPGGAIDQKYFISIYKAGRVLAVLDMYANYPGPGSIWIGLLLVHGSFHGAGIGSEITSAVMNAAKAAGYKTVQLGVMKSNEMGLPFWQKQGFDVFRHSGDVLVLAKSLA